MLSVNSATKIRSNGAEAFDTKKYSEWSRRRMTTS